MISGANRTLEKAFEGVLWLTGTNNFSGTYLHNGGVTVLNSSNGPALFNGTNGTLVIGNTRGNGGSGTGTWRGQYYSAVEIYRTNQLGTNVDVRLNPTSGNAYLSLRGFDTVIGNLSGTNPGVSAVVQNTEVENSIGPARLTVTQTTNFTGGTVVNEGRLVMRNTASGGNFTNNNAFVDFFADGSVIQLNGGTLSGTGTYVKRGASAVYLGANGSTQNISLSAGGLIDVQQGTLRNEYSAGNWANNLGSLNIAAGADVNLWDSAGGITVDKLTGAGTVYAGYSGSGNAKLFTVGVANGSGTFSGTLSDDGSRLNLVKKGTGTQTLSGSGSNNYSGWRRGRQTCSAPTPW
ncbi:MAG: hypothetical protein EBV34_17245 [Betaproteobacteria bacterium]|nr:hypothetical protein [Betaproteobacteria bacterium]